MTTSSAAETKANLQRDIDRWQKEIATINPSYPRMRLNMQKWIDEATRTIATL